MYLEFFISGRYLKSKRKNAFISLITLLSVIGVAVGVMTLIVVISVMSGYETEITARILEENSHVLVMHHSGPFQEYDAIMDEVKKIDGVKSAATFIYAQVMIHSLSGVTGAVLKGIDPDADDRTIKYFNKADLNQMNETISNDRRTVIPGIILGKGLAEALGVKKGDAVFVISPQGVDSFTFSIPTMDRFMVIDLFESGMYEYDTTHAYTHLKHARQVLNIEDAVTGIEVRLWDLYKADEIADRINETLNFPFWARGWMEMNKNLLAMLKLQKTVLFVILTLIILVAAFNITGTLIMMVMEKRRDIAILKSMGATRRLIQGIFILKGMIISVIGTAAGTGLGFILCALLKKYQFIKIPDDIYFLTTLPVQIKALNVAVIVLAALLICFFATLYPARQASGLNPVDAIRYG